MKVMERIVAIEERINALSLRERALLGIAALAVVFMLWDLLFMSGLRERHDRVQNQIEQVQSQVQNLTQTIQQTAMASADDPQADLERQRRALNEDIERLEARLAQDLGDVSTPAETRAMLSSLLTESPGLSLISLENLPVEPLQAADAQPIPGVFIHRIRVLVEGEHAVVRDYLKRAADLPGGVYLESVDLVVDQWPVNRVELMFYSLALDDRWLGV
jgi:MSHA biogenesis protein MshJ